MRRSLNKTRKLIYITSTVLILTTQSNSIQAVTFKEVSAISGIHFQSELNINSAGIAWIDINNDGNMDLFSPSANGPNRLYKNLGNGQFIDIAATAGIQLSSEISQGVAIGDFDNDGYDDIYIANRGFNTLMRNKGDETFENRTISARLNIENKNSYVASFGDLNNDGLLDLYTGAWAESDIAVTDDIYLNNGDGTLTHKTLQNEGLLFATALSDFDMDGDLDIFQVNDNISWLSDNPLKDNQVMRNDGAGLNFTPLFTPVGDLIGMGQSLSAMGIAIGDYDNDGDLDYFRTQIGNGVLSTNNNGVFTTIEMSPVPTGSGLDAIHAVGWGAVFFDADNDGHLDLYRGNNGDFSEYFQNNFYHNNGDTTFTLATTIESGLLSNNAGLGIATADYDNDGDIDIAVHGRNGDINLLRNDTVNTNTWLQLNLSGIQSNHRGIGTKVYATSSNSAGKMTQLHETHAGSSHGSNNAHIAHFGFPAGSTVDSIEVHWPMGQVDVINWLNIPINNKVTVIEGVGVIFNPTINSLAVNITEIGNNTAF